MFGRRPSQSINRQFAVPIGRCILSRDTYPIRHVLSKDLVVASSTDSTSGRMERQSADGLTFLSLALNEAVTCGVQMIVVLGAKCYGAR